MLDFEFVKNIAYLEPKCSFSEMAADEFMAKHNMRCFSTPLTTIRQVVDYVTKNPDTLGILPVENSVDGTIRESFDSLIDCHNPNIRIIEELIMPVEYCLLSKTTEFYSITGLIASPKVRAKCNNFINTELPRNYNLVESPSMYDSARALGNYNLTYASIGNKKIAQDCMLNVLKENINDNPYSSTRYFLIGDMETEVTGKDKTTVAFRTNHSPGALLKILNIFLENSINLTYISSQPSVHEMGEYTFIVTFDGHIGKQNMLKAIEQIKPKTSYFKYFGSYSTLKYSK